jgi:hypothetical protein
MIDEKIKHVVSTGIHKSLLKESRLKNENWWASDIEYETCENSSYMVPEDKNKEKLLSIKATGVYLWHRVIQGIHHAPIRSSFSIECKQIKDGQGLPDVEVMSFERKTLG